MDNTGAGNVRLKRYQRTLNGFFERTIIVLPDTTLTMRWICSIENKSYIIGFYMHDGTPNSRKLRRIDVNTFNSIDVLESDPGMDYAF